MARLIRWTFGNLGQAHSAISVSEHGGPVHVERPASDLASFEAGEQRASDPEGPFEAHCFSAYFKFRLGLGPALTQSALWALHDGRNGARWQGTAFYAALLQVLELCTLRQAQGKTLQSGDWTGSGTPQAIEAFNAHT
jgi:hypothetical protein